jgi:MobA/VirD2-like, nuclease domain
MPIRATRVARGELLLDLRSFARPGPTGRVRFSPAQLAQIVRTVSRAREVVVKVTKGATSTAGAITHLRYIDRNGKLEIETDEGERLKGKGIEKGLIEDWDLDSANALGRGPYRGKAGRKPSRLVHNVILSMPKGTSPEKLLLASRDFAREQFALKHRYALTLHTDQDHPHVHLIIKAVGEDGERLNIRKATLREWRGLFAQHLRAHGIPANATERAVRGQTRSGFTDGIHRAALRGDSRYLRERGQRIAQEVHNGGLKPNPGKTKLLETRRDVIAGWHAAADALLEAGHGGLAEKIWGFIGGMPRPLTTDEQLAAKLEERTRTRERERQDRRTR